MLTFKAYSLIRGFGRSGQLPIRALGLFEVYDTMAILSIWDHDIGNFSDRYSKGTAASQTGLETIDATVVKTWRTPDFPDQPLHFGGSRTISVGHYQARNPCRRIYRVGQRGARP